jgi:uncharacterized protein (UPF0333 family)
MKMFLTLLLIIVPSLYFGYVGKSIEMGLAIVAGSIAGAFLNLDKFESFKGAGFEAELKKAVDEAYATLDNLKEVTKPLIMVTVSNLTYANRWGGMGFDEKYRYITELEGIMKNLNINDEKVLYTYNTFYRYHTWDLYNEFVANLSRETTNSDLITTLSDLKDYSHDKFPTEEEINVLLGDKEIQMSEEVKSRLDKYILFSTERRLIENAEYNEFV